MTIYELWMEAVQALGEAKKNELALRKEICQEILCDKLEGAKTELVADGNLKVTATAKLNRGIDREVLETIWEDLTDIEKEAVVYKPSLVLANYKRLEQEGSKLMEAVTVKPGLASLKITPVETDE